MESDKEEQMVFLDRTTRASRCKRMTKLLDDEVEEAEHFWNQALKEEEHDDNYDADPDAVADEFHSDFNDDVSSEPEPDEVAENEKELRDLPKKRQIDEVE